MKVTTRHTTTHTVSADEFSDVDFEVSYEPVDWFDNIKIQRAGDVVVIGYLVQDDDAQDPLENSDGMGKMYSSHRHSSTHREMQEALGLNSDWLPNLDLIYDDCGNRQLVDDEYIEYFCDNTTAFELVSEGYENNAASDLEFQIACAEAEFIKPSWNMRFEDEYHAIQERVWRKLKAEGKIGNKYAQSIDVYEHSGMSFSLSGQGMNCPWDTARGGALWVPDFYCMENIELQPEEERAQYAVDICKGALKEYNAWHSGDVYGVVVAVCDAETGEELESDECWGYFISEHALKELESRFTEVCAEHSEVTA